MASFVPVIWESKWFGDLLLLQRSANPSQANDRVGNTNATFSRGRTPLNTPVSCPAGVSWVTMRARMATHLLVGSTLGIDPAQSQRIPLAERPLLLCEHPIPQSVLGRTSQGHLTLR